VGDLAHVEPVFGQAVATLEQLDVFRAGEGQDRTQLAAARAITADQVFEPDLDLGPDLAALTAALMPRDVCFSMLAAA
jgi:hypothetical protein